MNENFNSGQGEQGGKLSGLVKRILNNTVREFALGNEILYDWYQNNNIYRFDIGTYIYNKKKGAGFEDLDKHFKVVDINEEGDYVLELLPEGTRVVYSKWNIEHFFDIVKF